METLTQNAPALIPVSDQEFNSIIQAGPQALALNTEITEKALAAGNNLLIIIESNGMNDELDAKANAYQVKVKERLQEMYDRRTPLTRLFDKIKAQFTEQENKLSPKVVDSPYSKIQAKRNEYATKKAEEQKAREAEIKRKQDVDNAKINLLSEAKVSLSQSFEKYVADSKSLMLQIFDDMTLANAEDQKNAIASFPAEYTQESFTAISIPLQSSLLKWEELLAIKEDAKIGMYEQFAYQFKSRILEHRDYLLKQVPGKIQYLKDEEARRIQYQKDLEASNAAKRLEMEAAEAKRKADADAAEAKRKADAIAKLENERIKAEEDAKAKAEAEKQNAVTDNMFNNVAELLDNNATGSGAIESYEINVIKPAGWVLIFQKWFEKEGITKDNAAIEKKSLGQMKAFCEKLYTKDGEKIESPYLEYVAQYKMRAKK
jgi:hypothetical protein